MVKLSSLKPHTATQRAIDKREGHVKVNNNPSEAWRAFRALPTCEELQQSGHQFTAAMRYHMLLPQLLRPGLAVVKCSVSVHLDGEDVATRFDLSYQANACHRCLSAFSVTMSPMLTPEGHNCPHQCSEIHFNKKYAKIFELMLSF